MMWKSRTGSKQWAWDLTSTVLLVVASLWVWRTSRVNQELRAAFECGWSFEAQVGALRGVLSSGVIRSQPLRIPKED